MKRRTTIYLNNEIYTMAKKEILNLSAFIEETLKTHMFSDLNLLRSRITNLEKDLKLKKEVYRQLTLQDCDLEKYKEDLLVVRDDLARNQLGITPEQIRFALRNRITARYKTWTDTEVQQLIDEVMVYTA